ncbi:MAG: hypothetical protein KAJ91_02030 [Candidatus Aenigmarchaeota archaeon]|nr:hypothetical protein [Candidatus Aenigmarchaeota archaeon]
MIKIYARPTEIGQKAYSAVVDGLDLDKRIFTEEHHNADGFTENIIELNDPRTASLILDGHYGSGNADLYIHAVENGRMPSGLVHEAFKSSDSVLLETNHGNGIGNQKELLNESYVEVRKTDDVTEITTIITAFLNAQEPPTNKYFDAAVKNNGWHIEKKLFEVPVKPTYIITEGSLYGVPHFIESGIDAIRHAVEVHNFDIQSVGSASTITGSPANVYLFQYSSDAKKIKHILSANGIPSIFSLNKRKNMITPHFFDDNEKNGAINGASNLPNKVAKQYEALTIKEMQDSIIANVLADKDKEAAQLTQLYSERRN